MRDGVKMILVHTITISSRMIGIGRLTHSMEIIGPITRKRQGIDQLTRYHTTIQF